MGVGRGVAGVLGGGTWENWRRALKAGSGADLGPGRRDQGRKGRGQGFGGGGVRVWRQVPLGGAARAPSQAKGQVTILALPEPSRGSFLAGALWADASSLGLNPSPPPTPLGLRPQAQPRVRASPQVCGPVGSDFRRLFSPW